MLILALILLACPSLAEDRSQQEEVATYSKLLSKPAKALGARIKLARALQDMGDRHFAVDLYLQIFEDYRQIGYSPPTEVLSGWDDILREGIIPAQLQLQVRIESGAPVYDSNSARKSTETIQSEITRRVQAIDNGRVRVDVGTPYQGQWVKLGDRRVYLKAEFVEDSIPNTLVRFQRYLDAPHNGCCKADLQKTFDAYALSYYGPEEYLRRYPQGSRHETAQGMAEYNSFTAANEQPDRDSRIAALSEYVKRYPEGVSVPVAEQTLLFLKAERERSVGAYLRYIEKYPSGELTEKATEEVEELRFEEAVSQGDVTSLEEFLSLYPSGSRADRARSKLRETKADAALRSASKEEDYLRVARSYRGTKAAKVALERAGEICFSGARQEDTERALQAYLSRYSGVSYWSSRWARARRDYLQAARTQSYLGYRSFLESYDLEIGALSDTEERNLVREIVGGVRARGDLLGAMILAKQYRTEEAFRLAESTVRTPEEEIELMKVEPHRYFDIQMWDQAYQEGLRGSTSTFGKVEWLSAEVTIPVVLQMGSWGSPVQVRLSATISLEYDVKRRGLLGAPSRTERKTEVVERWVRIQPGGQVEASFSLGRRRIKDEKGTWLIGGSDWTLTDIIVPKIEFAEIRLAQR